MPETPEFTAFCKSFVRYRFRNPNIEKARICSAFSKKFPCLQSWNKGICIFYRTAVLLIGFRLSADVGFVHARTGGKRMPRYSLLDELTPVVFVPMENFYKISRFGWLSLTEFVVRFV